MAIKGAGILIVESYKNNPVITLFGKNDLNYSDLGGKTDPGELPEETAYREAREESANLINILPDELNKYAARIQFSSYAVYIIYVQNISFKDYAHNVRQIFGTCNYKQNHWKETNSMVRIPINNIINAATNNVNYAIDTNGYAVPVRCRTMEIIRVSIATLQSMIKMQPIKLHKHLVTSSRLPCLIGTYTYTISDRAMFAKSPALFGDTEYAINVTPIIDYKSDPFLFNFNDKGMHVTITGFHPDNEPAKKFIKYLSEEGTEPWTVSVDTIRIKKNTNTIYFESKTLDKIADFLHKNGFNKVKSNWHISSDCRIPKNIKQILKKQRWALTVVKRDPNSIKWLDRYPLHIL